MCIEITGDSSISSILVMRSLSFIFVSLFPPLFLHEAAWLALVWASVLALDRGSVQFGRNGMSGVCRAGQRKRRMGIRGLLPFQD
ncbi:hypothetical protein VTH06DRAFT_7764 [Thermothelomyces fergusii]